MVSIWILEKLIQNERELNTEEACFLKKKAIKAGVKKKWRSQA